MYTKCIKFKWTWTSLINIYNYQNNTVTNYKIYYNFLFNLKLLNNFYLTQVVFTDFGCPTIILNIVHPDLLKLFIQVNIVFLSKIFSLRFNPKRVQNALCRSYTLSILKMLRYEATMFTRPRRGDN